MKLKKFFSLLLVASLCLGFTSCNDDDDIFDPDFILGSWQFESLAPMVGASDAATSNAVGPILLQLFSSVSIPNFTLTFREDGTCTFSAPGETPEEATYTYVSPNKLTITGDLSILQLGNLGNSATFDVSVYAYKLYLELNMKPLLQDVAELQPYMSKITGLGVQIALDRVD